MSMFNPEADQDAQEPEKQRMEVPAPPQPPSVDLIQSDLLGAVQFLPYHSTSELSRKTLANVARSKGVTHIRQRGLTGGLAMTLAAVAALGLAACGSSAKGPATRANAKRAAQHAQAEYQKCNTELSSLMSAEENLNSHVDIGMNFTDYTNAVGNVRAAYDQTPPSWTPNA